MYLLVLKNWCRKSTYVAGTNLSFPYKYDKVGRGYFVVIGHLEAFECKRGIDST